MEGGNGGEGRSSCCLVRLDIAALQFCILWLTNVSLLQTITNYPNFLSTSYASEYLTALGAHPTKSNVNLLLSAHPLSSCSVRTVWRKEGGLRDAIVVDPVVKDGGAGKDRRRIEGRVSPNVKRAKEIFGAGGAKVGDRTGGGGRRLHVDKGGYAGPTYSNQQREILVRQSLMDLLRPLATTEESIKGMQELFCKKFPWETLEAEIENFLKTTAASSRGLRRGRSGVVTSPTGSPQRPASRDGSNNRPASRDGLKTKRAEKSWRVTMALSSSASPSVASPMSKDGAGRGDATENVRTGQRKTAHLRNENFV